MISRPGPGLADVSALAGRVGAPDVMCRLTALLPVRDGVAAYAAGHRRRRTPWCEAPIREVDHVVPHAHGGPTTLDNAQGYCQAYNRTEEALAWRMTVTTTGPDGHEMEITTPTGHGTTQGLPLASEEKVIRAGSALHRRVLS